MIVSDTGVLIRYWRKPSPTQTWVFDSCSAGICGITRVELYAGAKSELEMERFSIQLSSLEEIPVEPMHWELLGGNLRKLRMKGFKFPISDVLIATLALQHDFEVWT